ncbi:MAG: hypothetical protein M3680_25360 [Myxococcota bacterium]|nr:hypothetical protein [Myxococcota bacterium]
MVRPRWHDALIVVAIMALLATGVWALWWEDVRGYLDLGAPADDVVTPVPTGQT